MGARGHIKHGDHMNYSLNSLKGILYGTTIEVAKGGTRSLDYISFELSGLQGAFWRPQLRVL